jgi:predicted  nucleic acid-binding Zn-ribbon protein
MLKNDYDSLVKTALASPRIQTIEELKEAKEEISRLENRVNALTAEKTTLQTEISNLKKQIPKKPSSKEAQTEAMVSAFRRIPDKEKLDLLNTYNAKGKVKAVDRSEPTL